jgi:hypothetical protein
MDTIKLNKQEIMDAIKVGNSAYGSRHLVIGPDGNSKITWADSNRQWDPWSDDSFVAEIPALFPEGNGEDTDAARELLADMSDSWNDESESAISYVERIYPEEWAARIANASEWMSNEFLSAINGRPNDLGISAPWGYSYTETGDEVVAIPPFNFEWEKGA